MQMYCGGLEQLLSIENPIDTLTSILPPLLLGSLLYFDTVSSLTIRHLARAVSLILEYLASLRKERSLQSRQQTRVQLDIKVEATSPDMGNETPLEHFIGYRGYHPRIDALRQKHTFRHSTTSTSKRPESGSNELEK
jgi:hypothetical protein